MSKQFLQIHPEDNVLAALTDIPKGSDIVHNNDSFQVILNVKAKHKFTTTQLNVGDPIIMYGSLVGKATKLIAKGETITTDMHLPSMPLVKRS